MYAVIFSNQLKEDTPAYRATAQRMEELASEMPGFLGVQSVRDDTGFGITISYWQTTAAIENWRNNLEHIEAQKLGRKEWYSNFDLKVCEVQRESSFTADAAGLPHSNV